MEINDKLIKVGLINLTIVALIGVIMRYKIGFEFPYLDQKNLQHGHSHFAFVGWVSHLLYLFLFNALELQSKNKISKSKYQTLIIGNLICAFGMLVTFIIQGYGLFSILFSSISVLISYVYAWHYIKDSKHYTTNPSTPWFRLALVFNVLSSIGTFALAYMMMTKNFNQHAYLSSVYFYLHFQYSGWFFFGCMGLFISKLNTILPNGIDHSLNKKIFYNFGLACLPAYLLSVLWANLPWYLYGLAIIAVLLQFRGLWHFLKFLRINYSYIKTKWHGIILGLYTLSFIALVIKLSLQGGSIIPEISKLAFGFRSIVIAYLHLVLLGIITLFLLAYVFQDKKIAQNKLSYLGLVLFSCGVILNEFILMIQGISSFSYQLIPYLNEALLMVSLIMFTGLSFLIFSYDKTTAISTS